MAINYELVRTKINELNRTAISIVDMLAILERGTLIDTPLNSVTLTQTQIDGLKANLESEANNLKTIAGEIKEIVKEA